MRYKKLAVIALLGVLAACARVPYEAPNFQAFSHKESGYDLNFYWSYERPAGDVTTVKGYVQNVFWEPIHNLKLEVASLDAGSKVIEKKYFYAFPLVLGTPGNLVDDNAVPFQVQLKRSGNEKAYRFCYQYESPSDNRDNRISRLIGSGLIQPAAMRSWCFTDTIS